MHHLTARTLVAALVAMLAVSAAAVADPPDQVGRLSLVQGSVSLRSDGEDEWTTAVVNYPLTTGDSLWVDPRSRAEVHLADAVLRLGPDTEITFIELGDSAVQVGLLHGTLGARLRGMDDEVSFEIDTPTLAVELLREGTYRVDVEDDGSSRATVRDGRAEVSVDGLASPVREGQAATAAASGHLAIVVRRAPPEDEWDRWCAGRDSREQGLVASRYVPRVMIGYEDLDWYGSWSQTSEYGVIWVPTSVPAGWAPYRFGRWAWVKPWGWTWIDDEPWGFAPFHYGRWAHHHGRWVWVPGDAGHRPVYAPALVVFVEAGPGSLVIHGNVGWFPLGPREPYYPWYEVSPHYIQKVNVMHVRVDGGLKPDPAKIRYANQSGLQAVTVVHGDSFKPFRRVPESRIEVPEKELSGLNAGGAKAPPAPDRQGGLSPRFDDGAAPRPPAREKIKVKPSAKQPQEEPRLKPAPQQPQQQPKLQPQVKPAPQQPREEPVLKPATPQKQEQPKVQPAPGLKEKQPQLQKGSEKQKSQPAQKMRKVRKKKLVNGQWIWVEEWEPVEEGKN
jgi:hypothetical protein